MSGCCVERNTALILSWWSVLQSSLWRLQMMLRCLRGRCGYLHSLLTSLFCDPDSQWVRVFRRLKHQSCIRPGWIPWKRACQWSDCQGWCTLSWRSSLQSYMWEGWLCSLQPEECRIVLSQETLFRNWWLRPLHDGWWTAFLRNPRTHWESGA